MRLRVLLHTCVPKFQTPCWIRLWVSFERCTAFNIRLSVFWDQCECVQIVVCTAMEKCVHGHIIYQNDIWWNTPTHTLTPRTIFNSKAIAEPMLRWYWCAVYIDMLTYLILFQFFFRRNDEKSHFFLSNDS